MPGSLKVASMTRTFGSSIWAASQSVVTSGASVADVMLSGFLLRFPLLDRAAGVAPGGEAAAHMRDRLQAHVLRCLGGERGTKSAGAVKDELLVLLGGRLCIGG